MTAIAIWYDETNGNPFLWLAADSLVSANDKPLIEDAVKALRRVHLAVVGAGGNNPSGYRVVGNVLREKIDDPLCKSIGGDLQLVSANEYGCIVHALCKPYVHGEPAAFFSYLGRELVPDLRFVGDAAVGISAMA
jgi:hypothetical protein